MAKLERLYVLWQYLLLHTYHGPGQWHSHMVGSDMPLLLWMEVWSLEQFKNIYGRLHYAGEGDADISQWCYYHLYAYIQVV